MYYLMMQKLMLWAKECSQHLIPAWYDVSFNLHHAQNNPVCRNLRKAKFHAAALFGYRYSVILSWLILGI